MKENNNNEIVLLLTKYKELSKNVAKELKRAPEGSLMVVNSRNHISIRRDVTIDGKRHQLGIGKNPKMKALLAHKAFNQELMKRLENNIRLLESIVSGSISVDETDVLKALGRISEVIDVRTILSGSVYKGLNWPNPVNEGLAPRNAQLKIDPDKRFEWAAQPYLANTSFLEHKNQLSPRGVLCRSKSEGSILGIYDDLMLPYHTDESLIMNGRRVAPDIIGCRADGLLIYHEHKGVNSEEYISRDDYKDRIYKEFGIRQGFNLICTFDRPDGSVNLPLIREIIKDAYGL